MIPIDKGVPIPEAKCDLTPKYPWRTMEVGDSFLVTDEKGKKSVGGGTNTMGKKLGRKFTTRVVEEGIRVWRVE